MDGMIARHWETRRQNIPHLLAVEHSHQFVLKARARGSDGLVEHLRRHQCGRALLILHHMLTFLFFSILQSLDGVSLEDSCLSCAWMLSAISATAEKLQANLPYD